MCTRGRVVQARASLDQLFRFIIDLWSSVLIQTEWDPVVKDFECGVGFPLNYLDLPLPSKDLKEKETIPEVAGPFRLCTLAQCNA